MVLCVCVRAYMVVCVNVCDCVFCVCVFTCEYMYVCITYYFNYLDRCSKSSQVLKFMKFRQVGAELCLAGGQTDRQQK